MVWQRKVVWSEGMFIRPQHFQQQERYLEFFAHARAAALNGFFWGFTALELDQEALALGKIALLSASGIFPDGTPFRFPDQGEMPSPMTVTTDCKDEVICLACPMRRHGAIEVSFDSAGDTGARYTADAIELPDINSIGGSPAPIQIANLRMQLVPMSALPQGWVSLGVVHVVERRADNTVVLDTGYIPPSLSTQASAVLVRFARELAGLLQQRGELLAARLAQPGRGGVAEVADFLMLELLNRWQPGIDHLIATQVLHPERLFKDLLHLAGDLSTFTRDNRRPASYPRYDHDDLRSCFFPLMIDLRHSLSMVLEQNAMQLELIERAYGVRVAVVPSVDLLETCSFVLAVHADVPPETVRSHFPSQVKIGPVERIRDLVNLHLPGVVLRGLPIAPRQIPYHAGYNYFELDTSHDLWKQLPNSGGLAMHIAGEFPGLELEFWAIRR